MNATIKITITPLSTILIAAIAILWMALRTPPNNAILRLLSHAAPFLLLVASWIGGLALLRRC